MQDHMPQVALRTENYTVCYRNREMVGIGNIILVIGGSELANDGECYNPITNK